MTTRKTKEPTGFDKYLEQRMTDPKFAAEYERERAVIDSIDTLIRAIDDARESLELTKADMARKAGMLPEIVRRLLTSKEPNPTFETVLRLLHTVGLEIVAVPAASSPAPRTRRALVPYRRVSKSAPATRSRRTAPPAKRELDRAY